jgi:hypothetical protein
MLWRVPRSRYPGLFSIFTADSSSRVTAPEFVSLKQSGKWTVECVAEALRLESCEDLFRFLVLSRARARLQSIPGDTSFEGMSEVLAIVPAYNKEDVIEQTIRDLTAQGLAIYLVDNWSTDGTLEVAKRHLGCGLIGVERLPPDAAALTYDLESLLLRIEEIALTHQWANWVTYAPRRR